MPCQTNEGARTTTIGPQFSLVVVVSFLPFLTRTTFLGNAGTQGRTTRQDDIIVYMMCPRPKANIDYHINNVQFYHLCQFFCALWVCIHVLNMRETKCGTAGDFFLQ